MCSYSWTIAYNVYISINKISAKYAKIGVYRKYMYRYSISQVP